MFMNTTESHVGSTLSEPAMSALTVSTAMVARNVRLDDSGYALSEKGVYRIDLSKPKAIAPRAIAPVALGTDHATDTTYVKLAWVNSRNGVTEEWTPIANIKSKPYLLGIDDAPISLLTACENSAYLVAATGYLVEPYKDLTLSSRLGWVGNGDQEVFVTPDTTTPFFIGNARKAIGTVEGWTSGLKLANEMGPAGYPLLVVLGLCAASPLFRGSRKRNGVLGLVASSSQGKSTVFHFAVSMFGHPATFTIGADSTVKGIQDAALANNDMPVVVDELQRLFEVDPRKAEGIVYQGANGKTRTTSSKEQKAVGGHERFGATFYAAEYPLSPSFQAGANFRAIELDAPPLQSAAQAEFLQRVTRENYGALAVHLAAKLPALKAQVADVAETGSTYFREHYPHLKGDDSYTLSHIAIGLSLLADVTGEAMPTAAVMNWLANETQKARASTPDKAKQAFEAMTDTIQNGEWLPTDGRMTEKLVCHSHVVAWRMSNGDIDINPQAPMVKEALKRFEPLTPILKEWLKRGWLIGQDGRPTVKRRGEGGVYRVPHSVLLGNATGNAETLT